MAIEFAFIETIAQRSAFNPDAPPPANLAEAVRDNLILILNTRRGSVGYLPDYGMPDLSDYYEGFPGSLDELGRAIEETVTRYEPRLRGARVSLGEQPLGYFEANYLISGSLINAKGEELDVVFHTVVSGSGETEVKM